MSDDPFAEITVDSAPQFLFNTGTLYDLMTGSYHQGVDGKWYLSGGMGAFINGAHGFGNTYKSTFFNGLIAGILRIYPKSREILIDTESVKDKERLASLSASILTSDLYEAYAELRDRITFKSGAESDLGETYELLKKYIEIREKNVTKMKQAYPFLDFRTGKPFVGWYPFIWFFDSFTELQSAEAEVMLDSKEGFEDSKNKTIHLVEGNKKTVFTSHIRRVAEKFGTIVCATAHTGDNTSMNPMAPPTKQLHHMKQSDKIKGVGSKFEMLTQTLCQTTGVTNLQDSNKEALFPNGPTPDADLNEVAIVMQRNKTNISGTRVSFVCSQSEGMLPDVSNLHYLRTNDYVGLIGGPSKPTNTLVLYPDVPFSRKDFRAKVAKDYKLARALELTAQFQFIKNNWNISKLPVNVTQSVEEVYTKLKSHKTMTLDRVLSSTGYWTLDKTKREYLSLFDILSEIG